MRFTPTNAGFIFAVFVDGNGNGVLARDIQHNVDRQLHSPELLSSQFSGVDFGTLPDLPAIDAGSPPPVTIRSGSARATWSASARSARPRPARCTSRAAATPSTPSVLSARPLVYGRLPLRFAIARMAAGMTYHLPRAASRAAPPIGRRARHRLGEGAARDRRLGRRRVSRRRPHRDEAPAAPGQFRRDLLRPGQAAAGGSRQGAAVCGRAAWGGPGVLSRGDSCSISAFPG